MAATGHTFGERLKIFQKARFKSMRAMAEVCGIDENQLSKYANGVRNPDFEQWDKLRATGVNMHWLLTGTGPMDAPQILERKGKTTELGEITDADREYFLRIAMKLLERPDKAGPDGDDEISGAVGA